MAAIPIKIEPDAPENNVTTLAAAITFANAAEASLWGIDDDGTILIEDKSGATTAVTCLAEV